MRNQEPALIPVGQDLGPLHSSLKLFTDSLYGRNISPLTVLAYSTDVRQFIDYLLDTDITVSQPDHVARGHVTEYLSHLASQSRSGITRARKLAAIREFFRFLLENKVVASSPAETVAIPRKEKKSRVFLRPEEYSRLLAAAGSHPRDFAILQLFLQTGIRVSELANLELAHLDLHSRMLTVVAGKGNRDRVIDLEKKAIQAVRNYLAVRHSTLDPHVFINYQGIGISDRGVKKIVEKYRVAAGIEKRISAHSLRHTFGTYKAEKGVSPFQLKEWLDHASLATTQMYLHMGREAGKKAMEATSLRAVTYSPLHRGPCSVPT
jgi:site-specific recombinase XerD